MSIIGKSLAHYSITAQIGKGGMGEVYQATDTKLGRSVAIKVLPEEFAKDTDRVARFQREAKLLASLNHPNIAAIYGLEEANGMHFLVLELIDGDTLSDRIKSGSIPVEEALKLSLQISEALEAAHEKGVIHRDLKPANIKVTPEGKVKVLDFGLAKAYAGEQDQVSLSNSPTLSDAATMQGVILGTAAYMSPEQARGKPVDRRADIWAFGVVLYEMLTGKAAFLGKDVTDTLAAVIRSEPDWKNLPVNLHWRLREVLDRCLEKEAKDRYSGISDARVDIQKVLSDPSGVFAQSATVIARRSGLRTILPWIAGIILVGVIVGVVIWQWKTPETLQITSFYHELPGNQQYSSQFDTFIAVSPDGRQFAYSTNKGLFLRSIDELEARLITGTANENPVAPFYSPDGKWIAYFSDSDNQLKKIPVKGGSPIDLCALQLGVFCSGWWTDNKIIYSTGPTFNIMQIPANGGTPEILIEKEKEAMGILMPQMLPDEKSVLYTKLGSLQDFSIMVRSLESGETKEIIAGFGARYLPSGHIVYTKGDNLMQMSANLFAIPFDLDTYEVTGDPVSMGKTISGLSGSRYAVSDSGTLVYLPGTISGTGAGNTLVWVDRNGNEEPLGAPVNPYLFPKISPDGLKVALTIPGENQDIYIWDLVHKTMTRRTFDKSDEGQPIWSPDSKQILFSSDREDEYNAIYRKPADGTGEAEKIVSVPDRHLFPYYISNDGKTLVIVESIDGATRWDIGMLSLNGDHTYTPLLNSDEYVEVQPQISPDGRWIAYVSSESGRGEIYVRPFPDVNNGLWQVSTNGGVSPLWSPDGRELFYLGENDNSVMVVAVETEPTFSLLKHEKLFSRSSYLGGGATPGTPWDINPNDKRFLMLKQPGSTSSAEGDSRKIIIILNWFEELKERMTVD